MTLIARLYINDTPIGAIHVTRTRRGSRPDGLPTDDEVHTYRVLRELNGQHTTGTVVHRYGDGAWTLISKAATIEGETP